MIPPPVGGLDPDETSGDEHATVGQQRGGVLGAGCRHRSGRAERAGHRVVELGRRPDPVLAGRGAVVAAGEQDAPIGKQGRVSGRSCTRGQQHATIGKQAGGRPSARGRHRAGHAERAGRRVIDLHCRPAATGEEDAPVGEQGRRLAQRTAFVGRRGAGPGEARRQGGGRRRDGRRRRRSDRDPGRRRPRRGHDRRPAPSGCQVGRFQWKSVSAAPTTSPETRLAAFVPSASIVHQPGEAPPPG